MSIQDFFSDSYEDLVYEPEVDTALTLCEKKEVGVFITLLAAKLTKEALSKGIRLIFDSEPLLYESAFNVYAIASTCAKYWLTEENAVITDSDGRAYTLDFIVFGKAQPSPNQLLISVMREKPSDKFWQDFENLVTTPRLVYLIVTRGRPELDVSTAVFLRGVVPETLRLTFLAMHESEGGDEWLRKAKLIGRVPHDILLQVDADTAEQIASSWTPPPPPNSDYLHKKPRVLDELVLPDSVRAEIRRFIELTREEGRGSLLLVGLPASGRKTIARTIARELGQPAYHISIANILSRWLGESEAKLRAFFEGMRARGGVAVFENIEALFRKQTGENVTANLRSILYQEMARDDNNFVIVFTANEDAQPELFDSPLLGETKLIVPPPSKEERKRLARMFLRELVGGRWEQLVKLVAERYRISSDRAAETVYSLYADPIAGVSVGLTSGELYRVMKRIVLPAVARTLETGAPADITREVILLSKRDYTSRQAKLNVLLQRAVLLGYTDIADSILLVAEEVREKAIATAKLMEKYKLT